MMHDDEVPIDAELVERLVGTQLPHLADLPIREVRSTGTVNAIFRLGDQLCVRLPRASSWAADLDKECLWLPRLEPLLSLRVPAPVERGRPTHEYHFPWAVYGWIEGEPFTDDLVDDEQQAARDLARFVTELRRVEVTDGAPQGGRDPLQSLDAVTRSALEASRGAVDCDAALRAWDRTLPAPAWDGTPVWIHADLLRPNLLVHDGRLHAVIDFGAVGVGDPAADVIPAWTVFGPVGRRVFRDALDLDDGTWRRAKGYALHQAALIIPYYATTNPGFVTLARRTVDQILADDG